MVGGRGKPFLYWWDSGAALTADMYLEDALTSATSNRTEPELICLKDTWEVFFLQFKSGHHGAPSLHNSSGLPRPPDKPGEAKPQDDVSYTNHNRVDQLTNQSGALSGGGVRAASSHGCTAAAWTHVYLLQAGVRPLKAAAVCVKPGGGELEGNSPGTDTSLQRELLGSAGLGIILEKASMLSCLMKALGDATKKYKYTSHKFPRVIIGGFLVRLYNPETSLVDPLVYFNTVTTALPLCHSPCLDE
ncbi:unnamed protein product [Pleuronectes platessa]|uniref:Uncharacterized protein n=1 Tax=Pleuronectes platessa TaxID=8262 RepID=A0A9N7U0I7_PLEPL|nr:unnamed protein product [Pleuronectes platessa]